MKMLVAGVKRIKGTSQKTGNAYDMPKVVGLVLVENVKNANMTISGYGYDASEVALDPECLESFSQCKFPCYLDLETDVVPRFGNFETVVVGFKAVQAQPLPAKAA